MLKKTRILGGLAALLMLVVGVPASANTVAQTAAEFNQAQLTAAALNQSYESGNVFTGANVTCAISPYDAVNGSFRSAGGGSPQAIVENVTVKGQDYADFQVACGGADTDPFTVSVAYEFKVQNNDGTWSTIADDTPNVCTMSSLPGPGIRAQVASFSVPGRTGCEFKEFYPENDSSMGRSHALFVQLTVPNGGPNIQGMSKPWPMVCVIGSDCAISG